MKSDQQNDNSTSTAKRALRALQEMQSELATLKAAQREPIAIVGMGCRFPGANGLAAFWEMLITGRTGITEVPPDRWDPDLYYSADPKARGKIAGRWGGFVDDIELFDADFFKISPREAPHVDPRQRLMLEVTWEALEDAGIPPDSLAGTSTGVFAAALSGDYDVIICEDYSRLNSFTGPGIANSVISNRISYFLDLRGPSISMDTACSGSLVAIELACRSIRTGESTAAIAGGVGVNLLPRGDIFFSNAGALSPDGRCHVFDHRANGIVRGEGAGVVILKPLSRALADGDRIYALIRGGAVNHDGRSNGIMAPNGLAQEAMLHEAYRQADVSPSQVQFVETHGTGTPLGDPIEVNALGNVLGEMRSSDQACLIGSVKTNLGHLESAAGVAGVIKTALAIHHRLVPANLHFEGINPLIELPEFPMAVPTELTPWPNPDQALVAGVSGFSFGGTNVHLVLEEAPRRESPQRSTQSNREIFVLPLSARSPHALTRLAQEYRDFLQQNDEARLEDICYTAAARRSHFDYRLAVIGESGGEVANVLAAWLDPSHADEREARLVVGRGAREGGLRVVFVFSGQGTQWPGVGRELFDREPVFRRTIIDIDRQLREHVEWSLRDELFATDTSRLNETDIAQPGIFAIQVALAALWSSWGVVPEAIVGQSLGEVAAAHVAGILSLPDAVRVVFHRSRLMKMTAGKGLTAVVGLSPDETALQFDGLANRISIAGSSAPRSSVISGDPSAVEAMIETLHSRNVFARVIENVDVAFHSPQMEPLRGELEASLQEIATQKGTIPFYSTVTGGLLDGSQLGARYWGANLREPFQFAEVIRGLAGSGYQAFLEISPHPVLSGAIRQTLNDMGVDGESIATLKRDEGERRSLAEALGHLYVAGYTVDWSHQSDEEARLTGVPGYVWQRERYWIEHLGGNGARRPLSSRRKGEHPRVSEFSRSTLGSGERVWETELSMQNLEYLNDHRIQGALVIPGAAYVEMALSGAAQVLEGQASLEDVEFDRALVLGTDETRNLQMVISPRGGNTFRVFSRSTASPTPSIDSRADAHWIEHAIGRIVTAEGAGSRPVTVSLSELASRIGEEVDAEEFYRDMESRGFNFGPAFRSIKQLWRHDGEALALLELHDDLSAGARIYQVHPVLLDAGFQAIAATIPRPGSETYLPKSLRRLRILGRPTSRLWCHVRLLNDPTAASESIAAEIRFIGEDGQVVIEIDGLTVRRLDTTQTDNDRDRIFELDWRPLPMGETPSSLEAGRWMILADRQGVGEALATQLINEGDSCTVLFADDNRDLEEVVRETVCADGPPMRGVIHLWGIDSGEFSRSGSAGLERAMLLGPLAGLAVVRGLAAASTAMAVNRDTKGMWIVTRGAQRVGQGATAVYQTSLWGFGRSLAIEQGEMWGGMIDVGSDDGIEEAADCIRAELRSRGEEQEVAWREGERYVPRLKKWEGSGTAGVQCRADSSYLVSGGLSGLGLEAARWLIERGARRLILVGRRELPKREEWGKLIEGSEERERVETVKELERMGASIEYWAVNIGDEKGMREEWEREELEGRPSIRGIIHSAGVLDDALSMRMSEESYRRVQFGKVNGACVLHGLSEGKGLDFFIAYSSVSGVLGQIGQANYGAANAFLDGLMAYRREQGEAGLSIAWGPWSEVGMWSRLSQKSASSTSDAEGIEGITPKMGGQILERVFNSETHQVVVLHGNASKLRPSRLLSELAGASSGDDLELSRGDEAKAALLSLLFSSREERRTQLEALLRDAVGHVLRCESHTVSLHRPLPNLGLDSIMAVELKNSVESRIGLSVSMVDLFTASIAQVADRLEEQLENDERLLKLVEEIEQIP